MRNIAIIFCLISLCVYAGPHTLQRGESFEDVARLYDISLDSLKKCNPHEEEYTGVTIEVPVENLFYDLGGSDMFRKMRRCNPQQRKKGSGKFKSAGEKLSRLSITPINKRAKLLQEIQLEYEAAIEYGSLEALYQLGRRYIHGDFYPRYKSADFKLGINGDNDEFRKGIEYMQIVGLLSGNPDAFIELAVACGHEDSPIRNPYLCVSMLEMFAETKGWHVNELICYMYENGYGINKNLMQAYVYCSDPVLTAGSNVSMSKREALLKKISLLPKAKENSFYGNELDTKEMIALGLTYVNKDAIAPQGLYWLHKAAFQNDAEANWMLAGILQNNKYKVGSVGSKYDIDRQVMAFVEKAAEYGHEEADDYLKSYREHEAKKAEYERMIARQKQQQEAEKKARRRQMWTKIAGTVVQAAVQTLGQIEYAKQLSAYNQASIPTFPSIGGISESQWSARNKLAMEQIFQYTVNKTMSDWNGTPMVPTDMSAVNLGNDMSPGSPLWSWNMQQRINQMSTQNARMQCEVLAFYRRQTDMIAQQIKDNPFQPIAGYVNYDGNWISGESVGLSSAENSGNDSHPEAGGEKRYYDSERYGYKECHLCHGSGRCLTCNGSGIVSNRMVSGSSECPNCHLENMRRTGKCSRCQGRGYIYGL